MLIAVSALISLFALVMNKLPNSSIDNAEWTVAVLFGLQIFDFLSDINLSIELVLKLVEAHTFFLFICTIGCSGFVILPFVTNLMIAARIKSYVANNTTAISYFEQKSAVFVILCIVSGSVYPALLLISSRLFNLEMFDCGLTKYELRHLIHLKVIGSVLLENVPQLVFQSLYIGYSEGTPSNVAILSMTASMLSVIAALMSWIIECNNSNCVTVQYYIEATKDDLLSPDETDKIMERKERKHALQLKLCQALSIETGQLEIGHATVTTTGFEYKMIHYVFPNEYHQSNLEGARVVSVRSPNMRIDDDDDVAAMGYVKSLYQDTLHKKSVANIFLQHFDISGGFETVLVPILDSDQSVVRHSIVLQKSDGLANIKQEMDEDDWEIGSDENAALMLDA